MRVIATAAAAINTATAEIKCGNFAGVDRGRTSMAGAPPSSRTLITPAPPLLMVDGYDRSQSAVPIAGPSNGANHRMIQDGMRRIEIKQRGGQPDERPHKAAGEPPGRGDVDSGSQSGVTHGCNETFTSQAGFLRRQDGRKQRARAEEIAGEASPYARRLFGVADSAPLVQDDNAPQRGPAIQTRGHTSQQACQARGLIDGRSQDAAVPAALR